MTEIRLEKSLPSEQERIGQPSVPAEGLERYFAREGVDPLPYAFEGKIAVHPGLGGSGVEKQDFEATLEPLLAEPRTGKTVAYIHVPFCETHCLYCGFYNKAYREDESRIYADALIQELRLWRGRPGLLSATPGSPTGSDRRTRPDCRPRRDRTPDSGRGL